MRTDFILSAEIITIALGTVAGAPFGTQVLVLVGIALAMTAGVYGLVAGIVKLDDAGLHLARRPGDALPARLQRALGGRIVRAAPWLMRGLSAAGTAAMFLVGGGILTHGIPVLRDAIGDWSDYAGAIPGAGAVFGALASMLANAVAGILAGAVAYAATSLARRLRTPAVTKP